MSKEVKRYNFDVDKFGSPRAYESEHGRWIKRDDYEALLEENEQLRATQYGSGRMQALRDERDALLAERDRLAAENERLARDAKNDSIAYRAVIERQAELRAEVEALKKDAERLDRLDIECEAYGCEGTHEGNRWMIDGPFRTVRDAIDAALQGAQP